MTYPTDIDMPTETPGEPKLPSANEAIVGLAPETVNLAETLPETELKRMAEKVIADYKRDWNSGTKFREHRAQILKLYLGQMPPLPEGEQRAQVHYHIVGKAINRMHARIYDQQFPSNGEFFGVKPTDALDLGRAVRVAKHLNWQIAHQIPEYVPNHDALIKQMLLYGSAFSYVYYNPKKGRVCHAVCATEDIVLPYKCRHDSVEPSLSDVPRITRKLRKYRHELEEMQDGGYYTNVEKLYPKDGDEPANTSGYSQDSNEPVKQVIDRHQGVEPADGDPDAPYLLLEQHRWWKLPGEKRERPVIITVEETKKCVVCVKLREDEDPQDRARYNREKQANEASYAAAMEQFEASMAQYMGQQIPNAGPMGPGMDMTQPPMPGVMDSTMPIEPMMAPQPPQPPPEPTTPKMIPIDFFTHYVCDPNPEGIYGLGIGHFLEGNNIVADTIASQMVDAGTLANTVTGIRSRQTKLRGGDFRIRPGEIAETDVSPQDLEKSIHILKFPGPDATLGQFIKDQKEEADEMSGANEILSGEVGGSNETATTTQIRISQALMAIAIVNKRYTRARTVEGQKIARNNSVYLTDQEYFTVVDPMKQVPQQPQVQPGMAPEMGPPGMGPGMAPALPPWMPKEMPEVMEIPISRMDYLEDVDITFTADPRMASQPQRFEEAMKMFNIVMSTPALQMNPLLVAAVAKKVFVAADSPELVAALGAMPMMPMVPQPPPGKDGNGPPQEGAGPPDSVPNGGPAAPNAPFMGQAQ